MSANAWRQLGTNRVQSDEYRLALDDAFGEILREQLLPQEASGGGTTTLVPTTGSVDVTGYAPRISLRLVPGTGDINVTGYAPGIVTVTRLSPATAQIDVTGYAPTLVIPREEQETGGGSGLYRRPRMDDYLPPLERERVLRPASAAGVLVRGYAPTLRRSVRIAEDIEFDIPDEVLAMALELLEEWETA